MSTPPTSSVPVNFRRRGELSRDGWSDRALRAAVKSGVLIRPRSGMYLPGGAPRDVIDAARHGGRLTCVSELARHGVFVLDSSSLHIQLDPHSARLPAASRPLRRHWTRPRRQPHPSSTSVEVFDALLQAARCQSARPAVATLDSALHLGLLSPDDIDELFRALPRRYRVIRSLLDGRCESGPETLVRLMLRSLGVSYEVQVQIRDVGRVDFVVDGWLIIECNSLAHHSTWEAQRRDRRRDQAAARQGFATYRPIAEDIMWHADEVRSAIAGLLMARGRPRVERSGENDRDQDAGADRSRFS